MIEDGDGEILVSLDTAKLFENLDFDAYNSVIRYFFTAEGKYVSAPSQEAVKRWLYEKHGYFISVEPDFVTNNGFTSTIYRKDYGGKWYAWGRISRSNIKDNSDPYDVTDMAIATALKSIIEK